VLLVEIEDLRKSAIGAVGPQLVHETVLTAAGSEYST
jgi:hypothetical protein